LLQVFDFKMDSYALKGATGARAELQRQMRAARRWGRPRGELPVGVSGARALRSGLVARRGPEAVDAGKRCR